MIRAHVPGDPGYFGERLTAARNQIIRAWDRKTAYLKPEFKQTDIFGALELASQILAQDQGATRRELVVFSDIPESIQGLDFEGMRLAPQYLAVVARRGELPDMRDVHVLAMGVDGAGKSTAYWESLRRFWRDYFQNAGVAFERFSVLRGLPLDR